MLSKEAFGFSSAEIKSFWFTQSKSDPAQWICEACKTANKSKFMYKSALGAGATNLVKKVKANHEKWKDLVDLSHIPTTSVVVERFFSQATDRRGNMLPITLELFRAVVTLQTSRID